MNDVVKNTIKTKRLSLYELSAKSGVPYNTISRIIHDKININNISAEAVDRIARVLDIQPRDLLNPYHAFDGIKGHYGKIGYRWKDTTDGMMLVIKVNGETIYLETDCDQIDTRHMDMERYFAEIRIDKYLQERQFNELYDSLFAKENDII